LLLVPHTRHLPVAAAVAAAVTLHLLLFFFLLFFLSFFSFRFFSFFSFFFSFFSFFLSFFRFSLSFFSCFRAFFAARSLHYNVNKISSVIKKSGWHRLVTRTAHRPSGLNCARPTALPAACVSRCLTCPRWSCGRLVFCCVCGHLHRHGCDNPV
jgi:hypothetical protein